jgi:hypothetical protein
VSLNKGRVVWVQTGVMSRHGLLVMLGILLLATPASAAGEKSWTGLQSVTSPGPAVAPRPTTTVLPASSPFVVTTKPFAVTTQPFAASAGVNSPLPAVVTPVPEDRHRHRRFTNTIVAAPAPQVIVVQQPVIYQQTVVAASPSECVTPGYWSYHWIPYTTTQNVWVPGSWGADGTWTDSRWEPRAYSSGYYEPFWTPGC